ncbi:Uma2 family endonuclease [Pendulispora brunnea]|uniref:Uma2 family endonuclease n=1 Tax=Pendulispora brunnea TaxID=2905690 RepID=A0ABZ2K8W3_9BACT
MSGAVRRTHGATWADIADRPEEDRLEIVGGEVVQKAAPTWDHGLAQTSISAFLVGPYQWGRGDGPGGWWFGSEVDIELETHEVYRPDVAGWRKDRVPKMPPGRPVRVRPDWSAEVLSKSNAERDLGDKLFGDHRAGVPHYWILDPQHRTLTVYRYATEGYFVALTAGRGKKVRAEPFEEVEIEIDLLFEGAD